MAGCTRPAEGPDPSLSPQPSPSGPPDIDAPPPEDTTDPVEFEEPEDPTDPYTIFGRVTDLAGTPLANALVWIEGANLREPVNNLDQYETSRAATLQKTTPQGRFEFRIEGGYYFIIAEAPGYLPQRSTPAISEEAPTRVNFSLVPDVGTRAIAHRGSAYYAPENTLSAVRKGILLGAQTIEVDVVLTADEHVVVMHDEAVDRTTNGTGLARSMTLARLQQLDAGAWFHESFRGETVPTLVQLFDVVREAKVDVILDIKGTFPDVVRTEQRVVETIRQAGMEQQAVFATFREDGVRYCGQQQGLRCALISRGPGTGAQVVDLAHSMGATSVLLRYNLTTPAAMNRANETGLRLFTWTLNEVEEWEPMIRMHVHGIITDRSGFLIDYLGDRGRAAAEAAAPKV